MTHFDDYFENKWRNIKNKLTKIVKYTTIGFQRQTVLSGVKIFLQIEFNLYDSKIN